MTKWKDASITKFSFTLYADVHTKQCNFYLHKYEAYVEETKQSCLTVSRFRNRRKLNFMGRRLKVIHSNSFLIIFLLFTVHIKISSIKPHLDCKNVVNMLFWSQLCQIQTQSKYRWKFRTRVKWCDTKIVSKAATVKIPDLTFNDQCSHYIETSQLTGFYMVGTMVVKGLIWQHDTTLLRLWIAEWNQLYLRWEKIVINENIKKWMYDNKSQCYIKKWMDDKQISKY